MSFSLQSSVSESVSLGIRMIIELEERLVVISSLFVFK